jgi:acetyltransferase-like isoleucine patch superfamily enzyme
MKTNQSIKHKLWEFAVKKKQLSLVFSALQNMLGHNRKMVFGTGNRIHMSGAFLRQTRIEIRGNNNVIELESNAVLIASEIIINGNNHYLTIGKKCIMKKSSFCFEDNDCQIIVGTQTTAEGIHVAALENATSVVIGEDCMFSAGIDIRNSDSHSIIDMNTDRRINPAKSISIGDHVWVGEDVKVLKGSIIGNHSVIGAGSIVTGELSQNCVAAGIPARVVKQNITWTRKRI